MSTNKQIVEGFYTSDFFNESEHIEKYLHPEMELFWNAQSGYLKMNRDELLAMAIEAGKSFDSVRAKITHLLDDQGSVTIRFTFYVTTIEAPDEEFPVAHFFAIWEIKEGKMYRGYQMSQPPEESKIALESY